MIVEIEKPKIKFKFNIDKYDKFYFDDIQKIFFIKNKITSETVIFNYKGIIHNENGYSVYIFNNLTNFILKYFSLNNDLVEPAYFAFNTNHLICKSCEKFCKQQCFI